MGRGSHDKEHREIVKKMISDLGSQGGKHKFVLDASISPDDYVPINLSKTYSELADLNIHSPSEMEQYVQGYLQKHNAKVAYGGYMEERRIYEKSPRFSSTDNGEPRNIHLGMDFWCHPGTQVLAVLRGKIHSFHNNDDDGNYGPTIIIEHYIQGERFYTLYGHLSLESLEGIEVGQEVEDGEPIGYIGTSKINGGYAPHLHFQIIEDLQGFHSDYPGVGRKSDLYFYQDNCPDPNSLIKFLHH
jgi:murein DD-endopeptidase MepM/ murein hydrolase activator NlpD